MPNALLFLADGFEETEAVTPLDLLRRAGADVTAVSISGNKYVRGSHNIIITADAMIAELSEKNFDALVLPGGMPGSTNLAASKELDALLRKAAEEKKLIAAICAAPAVVLAPKGLLKQKKFTCYSGMEKDVSGAEWLQKEAVTDGNIITSRGVGTAISFAAAIIEYLCGKESAKKILNAIAASSG